MNVVVSGNLFPLCIEIKRGEACSSKEDSSCLFHFVIYFLNIFIDNHIYLDNYIYNTTKNHFNNRH